MKTLFTLLALSTLTLAVPAQASSAKTLDCYHRASPTIASCYGQVKTNSVAAPLVSGAPSGYGPAQFHTAYSVPVKAVRPVTVGVVVAYHDAALSHDVAVYDAAFGLPAPPSLVQVSQRGTKTYPLANAGWGLEESMDVETVHQMCQNCSVVVVEADSAAMADLSAAVTTAERMGASVVSNSYGGSETSSQTRTDAVFNQPGVTVVASAGDDGYGVSYPAASPYVVAVGGTKLTVSATGARRTETAWTEGGSGCSSYEPKPSWQHDVNCAKRAVADLSADADPATGAAIYDSASYEGKQGWFVLGGTSLSAPLVAGMVGLAGGTTLPTIYSHASVLRDITSGTNGSCVISYLCKARAGYDGPSGLGSPNGLGVFGR